MRRFTARELTFRATQEAFNLGTFLRPPRLRRRVASQTPFSVWPSPETVRARLQSSPLRSEILGLADEILAGRIPVFGRVVETGASIAWRRDYRNGRETGRGYFRFLPYLDFSIAGDHKEIWEINRHQHLVLLAQAWVLSSGRRYLDEIETQLASWFEANPYARGINWTSALEVAFRALSWLWILHLAGDALSDESRNALHRGLYQHACHLRRNLSFYFSPNTHLLGEAVALHAVGRLLPDLPGAGVWRSLGASVVDAEFERQVRADGGYFEQSTYYHVYAMDFFLLHSLLRETPPPYMKRLVNMGEFATWVTGPSGELPFFGDDDGGRLYYPYGERSRFVRASLATFGCVFRHPDWIRSSDDLAPQAAWWLHEISGSEGVPGPHPVTGRVLPESGFAVLGGGDIHIVVKTGPFGPGGAGHSHSDVLSLVARNGGTEILIDPGSFTYVADPVARDRFRGAGYHNTLRIDERDQGTPVGPFRWSSKPDTALLLADFTDEHHVVQARCSYDGFSHIRTLVYARDRRLLIVCDDAVSTTPEGGEHLLEQFWHTGVAARRIAEAVYRVGDSTLIASHAADEVDTGGEYGWRSRVLGSREAAPAIRITARTAVPARMVAVWLFTPGSHAQLELSENTIHVSGPEHFAVRISGAGAVQILTAADRR